MNKNLYYKHSGKIPVTGLIILLVIASLGTILLSAAYGYAMRYIPFIVAKILIILLFGLGVGAVVGAGVNLGKIRNNRVALLAGLLFGLAAVYLGWVSYIYALSKQRALIIEPVKLWQTISVLAANGVWKLKGMVPKGGVLYAIWAIEALTIAGMSTLISSLVMSNTPYCGRCKKWTKSDKSITHLEKIENNKSFKESLEQGNLSVLYNMKMVNDDSSMYTNLILNSCDSCHSNYYLSVKNVIISSDANGKTTMNEHSVIDNLVIAPETFNRIKGMKGGTN